ncbi:MAG: LON peptidase substrate-binding domain-containing protein [Phycisphaerales bacterium]
MSDAVQVNFGRPIPLFPLDSVALLPQQVLPLHVFEPRYRQMVEHALDGNGLIAMAVFEGDQWKQEYHGRPRIRPVVCVGHIVQHSKRADGRYDILLQGVCRARVLKEVPPTEDRLYRAAYLEPFSVPTEGGELSLDDAGEQRLRDARTRITEMLSEGPLSKLTVAEPILEYLRNEEIPTHAILELVAFPLTQDQKVRYRLLAEEDAGERARIILQELGSLERIVRLAVGQHPEAWPKGLSWN